MSTFYGSHPFAGNGSDNLLMQRQAVCLRQDNVYHLLFLGGVVRDNVNIYMIGFVSYDSTQT